MTLLAQDDQKVGAVRRRGDASVMALAKENGEAGADPRTCPFRSPRRRRPSKLAATNARLASEVEQISASGTMDKPLSDAPDAQRMRPDHLMALVSPGVRPSGDGRVEISLTRMALLWLGIPARIEF